MLVCSHLQQVMVNIDGKENTFTEKSGHMRRLRSYGQYDTKYFITTYFGIQKKFLKQDHKNIRYGCI